MKSLFPFLLCLLFFVPAQLAAGTASPVAEQSYARYEAMSPKQKARMTKKAEKWKEKLAKKGIALTPEQPTALSEDEYLRYGLILLLSALVLGILSIFASVLWFLAGLAAIGAAVFFILYIVEVM